MFFVQRGLSKTSVELSGREDCRAEGLTDVSKVVQSQLQRRKSCSVFDSVDQILERRSRIKQGTQAMAAREL